MRKRAGLWMLGALASIVAASPLSAQDEGLQGAPVLPGSGRQTKDLDISEQPSTARQARSARPSRTARSTQPQTPPDANPDGSFTPGLRGKLVDPLPGDTTPATNPGWQLAEPEEE